MPKLFRQISCGVLVILSLASCSPFRSWKAWDTTGPIHVNPSVAPLRPLTTGEALQDFEQLANTLRAYYGPMEYKEARFGFSFEQLVTQTEGAIRNAKTEAEVFGLFAQFVSRFEDGHTGIGFATSSGGIDSYVVPIFIAPMGDKVAIAEIDKGLKNTLLKVGDEVLEIDGKPVWDYLPTINKYLTYGYVETNKHAISLALDRPFYMTELTPKKNTVSVKVRHQDGSTFTEDLVWKLVPHTGDDVAHVEDKGPQFVSDKLKELENPRFTASEMGRPTPFFATKATLGKYSMRIVGIDEEHRKKYGIEDNQKPNIFGVLYRYKGRTILLVRNHSYSHRDLSNMVYLRAYQALLDQWDDIADVLVLDQTHNTGGSYCEAFFRLFINEEKDGLVLFANTDRKWISDLRSEWSAEEPEKAEMYKAFASTIEAAYDRGEKLSEPLAIFGGGNKVAPLGYTWKKPMLVLIDELSVSCGDAFPMLVKNNKVAKLFGARTAGMGGNVERMDPLPFSQARLRITRSLFTSHRDDGHYDSSVMMENNGVEPDYPYRHTIEDFREGYVGYVEAFSEKAIEQIR